MEAIVEGDEEALLL
jgi:hypothetical protein